MYKLINDMYFTYRIGENSDVQKLLPDGTWWTLKPRVTKKYKEPAVLLRVEADVQKWITVDKLMERYFYGKPVSLSRKNIAVEKVDATGRVVGTFDSISDAARDGYISSTAVRNRVHKLVKHPYALNGYDYRAR